jgi:putative tricarboxylic transport membrane protein
MKSERIAGVLMALFSGYILVESRTYSLGTVDNPGPGFLPLLCGVTLGLLSVIYLVKVWWKKEPAKTSWPGRGGLLKVGLIFLALLLFTVFLPVTGYLVNTFALFVILLRPVGKQRWPLTVVVSAAAVVVSYLLFDRWLMVPLPRGIWFP